MSASATCRLPLLPGLVSTPSAKSAGTGEGSGSASLSVLRVRNTFLHLDSGHEDLESDCSSTGECRPSSDPGRAGGASPDVAFEDGFATDDGEDTHGNVPGAGAERGELDGFATDDDENMTFHCERDDVAVLQLEVAAEQEAARLIRAEADRVSEQGLQLRALQAQLGGDEGARKRQDDLRDRLEAAEHDLEQTLDARQALEERMLADRQEHEDCRALRAELAAALADCEAAQAAAGRFSALRAELAAERDAAVAELAECNRALAAEAQAREGGAAAACAAAPTACGRLAALRERARDAEQACGSAQQQLRAVRDDTAACKGRLEELRSQEGAARGRAADAAAREDAAGAGERDAAAELELARSQLASALGEKVLAESALLRGSRRLCGVAALLPVLLLFVGEQLWLQGPFSSQ